MLQQKPCLLKMYDVYMSNEHYQTLHTKHSMPKVKKCRKLMKTVSQSDKKEALVRGFRQKSTKCSCGNEAFVRDLLQKVQVEVVKTKLSCVTPLKNCGLMM